MKHIISLFLALALLSCNKASDDLVVLNKIISPAIVTVDAGNKSGTGFFINHSGSIATNYHVIRDSARITVKRNDGSFFAINKIISADADKDLAILSANAKDMPCLEFGSSETVEVGTKIVVIGSPLGLEYSLSEGIISAKRKDDKGKLRYLQITAPISPGSSGSPVVTFDGKVIGIVVLTLKDGQALNMAIPIDDLKDLANKQINNTSPSSTNNLLSEIETILKDPMCSGVIKDDDIADIDLCRRIVDKYPNYPFAHYLYGFNLKNKKLYEDAIVELNKCISIANVITPRYWYEIADCYHELYINNLNAPDKDSLLFHSEKALREAIKINSKYYVAWRLLGFVYSKLGRFSDSLNAYKECLNIRQDDYEVYFFYGYSAHGCGDYNLAIDALIKALSMNSRDSRIYHLLAIYSHELKQYNQEYLYLYDGLKLFPSDKFLLIDATNYYLQIGDAVNGRILYNRLYIVSPNDALDLEDDIRRLEGYNMQ